MDVPTLEILVWDEEVPMVGMCKLCKTKFFVPREGGNSQKEAEAYLWAKHLAHICKSGPEAELEPPSDQMKKTG